MREDDQGEDQCLTKLSRLLALALARALFHTLARSLSLSLARALSLFLSLSACVFVYRMPSLQIQEASSVLLVCCQCVANVLLMPSQQIAIYRCPSAPPIYQ